jgi:hypothetical protein
MAANEEALSHLSSDLLEQSFEVLALIQQNKVSMENSLKETEKDISRAQAALDAISKK